MKLSIEISLDSAALQDPEELRRILFKIAEDSSEHYEMFKAGTDSFPKRDIYGNGYFETRDINGNVVAGSKFYLKDFPEDN